MISVKYSSYVNNHSRLITILVTQVVLVHLGVTSLIAHIKVGQMHAALESKVLVVSTQGWLSFHSVLYLVGVVNYKKMYLDSVFVYLCWSVCGDDVCELEESCLTCPADCGVCPMATSIKVAIGLPVALICTGFVLTVVVRKKKHLIEYPVYQH